MADSVPTALLITLIGMGLIFAAILVFWLVMALLARWTGDRGQAADGSEGALAEGELRRRAALAAVAVALAMEADEGPGKFPLPPTALVSTWQAVMRARLLSRRRSVR